MEKTVGLKQIVADSGGIQELLCPRLASPRFVPWVQAHPCYCRDSGASVDPMSISEPIVHGTCLSLLRHMAHMARACPKAPKLLSSFSTGPRPWIVFQTGQGLPPSRSFSIFHSWHHTYYFLLWVALVTHSYCYRYLRRQTCCPKLGLLYGTLSMDMQACESSRRMGGRLPYLSP